MSDFDREAEREKLREKYERDKEKREASERMSELLLQGATMTNRHCPECQSPVFRYEGREFCPTCEKEVAADGEEAGREDGRSTASRGSGPETEDPTPKTEAETAGDIEGDGTETDAEPGSAPGADPEQASGSPPRPARDRRPARVDPPASADAGGNADAERDGSGERIAGPEADYGTLQEAERTLVDEIASLSRRAAETRDIGRKRDLLAAAREAAETLETVRRL